MALLLDENVREVNAALCSKRDKGARWWNFCVSHTTFDLVIGDPLGEDNVVLCLPGCGYLAGPVQWPNQQIEVELVGESTVIQDRAVGFRAEGGRMRWRKNYDIWSLQGIWTGRGVGPEGALGIDDVTLRLKKWLVRYYAGEIGFAELAYHTNAVLWHSLPATGKGQKPNE